MKSIISINNANLIKCVSLDLAHVGPFLHFLLYNFYYILPIIFQLQSTRSN